MKIVVTGHVPIPVGHRVIVRWYEKTEKGLFGGKSTETHPLRPVVEHVETGIVYSQSWLHDAVSIPTVEGEGVESSSRPLDVSDSLSAGVKEIRAVEGAVASCRVVVVAFGGSSDIPMTQTEITLAEGNGPSPFR